MSRRANTLERLIAATATPLPPVRRTRAARDEAAWVKLAATVPPQEQTNWCWCATALGVHRFYEPGFDASQCEVAGIILQRDDTCADPTSSEIDKPFALKDSLDRLGNFRAPRVDEALSFEQVRGEIDRGAPVGVRIQWLAEEGAHFVLITGYRAGPQPQVAIQDPRFDSGEHDYQHCVAAYLDRGAWSHSYRTQPHQA